MKGLDMATTRGRPSKGDQAKRSAIAVRTNQRIKERLMEAARENDRSITQQVEQIIESWFALEAEFGGARNLALFKTMAQALSIVESNIGDWRSDYQAFVSARDSIAHVMDSIAPPLPPEITKLFNDACKLRDEARAEKDAIFPELIEVLSNDSMLKPFDSNGDSNEFGLAIPYTPILDDDLSDAQLNSAILALELNEEHATLLRQYHQAKRKERIGARVVDQAVGKAKRFQDAARQRASVRIRNIIGQGNG